MLGILLASLVFGVGMMIAAYLAYRYGEHYEYGGGSKLDLKQFTGGDYGKMFRTVSDTIKSLDGSRK